MALKICRNSKPTGNHNVNKFGITNAPKRAHAHVEVGEGARVRASVRERKLFAVQRNMNEDDDDRLKRVTSSKLTILSS